MINRINFFINPKQDKNSHMYKSESSTHLPSVAGKGDVHKGLVMQEVLEDREEVVLMVVPSQTILLRVAQQDTAAAAGVGTRDDAAGCRGHRRGSRGKGGHLQRIGGDRLIIRCTMHRCGRRGSESCDERGGT